jgi:ABC-type multidrug transport system ATPase subunit
MAYVETVIRMLDMEDIADAIIGVPGAGLNLERRKRVSIGVELAAKPDILLFLDEPTSGLDGNSALSIVQLMRKLSNAGQTILCTIHQPSSQMIELFDSLLLLIPGGKTAYFGPLGPRCTTIIDYFARYTRRCGDTENPADYLLDISADPRMDWLLVRLPSLATSHLFGSVTDFDFSTTDLGTVTRVCQNSGLRSKYS